MLSRAFVAGVGASVVSMAAILPAVAAGPDVITVTNNATCSAPGSLEDALIAANASTNADGVRIVFDASLAGTGGIEFTGATCKMHSDPVGAPGGNHQRPGQLGARFLVDSQVPVTIDFSNLDDITTTSDADFATFLVASDNVRLENLKNLQAGAAGIAISGSNVTVDNVDQSDPSTIIAETGVAILDGASNVTISNSDFASQWWASILIDGSTTQDSTVSNIVIDNVTSRGVESGIGHIDIEDRTTVNGLTVRNSTFGVLDAETSTSHAVYFNTALKLNNFSYTGNKVERGAGVEKNVFYFENSINSVFANSTVTGNTFTGVSKAKPLSRLIGSNNGTWNGLNFSDNEAKFTRGILLDGTLSNVTIDGNDFVETHEPAGATITLANTVDTAKVSNNLLDTAESVDGVRVHGTSAKDVVIENNKIHDFYAGVSRSAVAIIAPGTGNVVRGNEFVQDLSRAGVDLPATLANHWAVYVWLEASAASATESTGWQILNNHIDGYGGTASIASQAPITNNAIGKTVVTGNTFGQNTRGSFDPETENLAHWFLWNDHATANNRVQTFRAERVSYKGTKATFTATQPALEAGNNAASAPVTLHVYWTADDNAEEYLGSIEDVTAGERVAINTTHTNGNLRVQTVDANGFTSQYSSIDKNLIAAPSAPAVGDVDGDKVSGTGQAGATVEVRDADGNVVGTATVAADGTWSVDGLECDTDYTAVQIVDGEESDASEFTTAECSTGPVVPDAPEVGDVDGDKVSGNGRPGATVEVRDGNGNVVGSDTVAADGTWSVDGLECDVDYTAVQIVDDEESEASEFTTAECAAGTGDGDKDGSKDELADAGSSSTFGMVALGALLLAIGAAATFIARRREV